MRMCAVNLGDFAARGAVLPQGRFLQVVLILVAVQACETARHKRMYTLDKDKRIREVLQDQA